MRNFMCRIVLVFLLLPAAVWAQTLPPRTMYVAHKAGLSIRETPDVKAKVLAKIPYAVKVVLNNIDTDTVRVSTEGFTSSFHKVTYNNKTGYIIGAYLLPFIPPKATVKTLTDYLAQLAPKSGSPVEIKKGTMLNIAESGYTQKKQLYKNGGEHHEFSMFEYHSDTWMIPDLTVQQAWLLLRLIPDFKFVATEKDELPRTSKKITKNNIDYDIKVEKNAWNDPDGLRRVSMEFMIDANHIMEIFILENQVVIFLGSGL
jgi:hypothetical protein